MAANPLTMNNEKTDFVGLVCKHQLAKIQSQSVSLKVANIHVSTCLEVRLDNHVQYLARRFFYHLRQLRTATLSLTTDSAKTPVHALIVNRLDYCNNVLDRINVNATKTLTPVRRHWELISAGCQCRRGSFTNAACTHLKCSLKCSVRTLRSSTKKYACQSQPMPVAAHGDLQVLPTRTRSVGRRSLLTCAPKLWNSLPPSSQHMITTLKTFGIIYLIWPTDA